jgi:predicted transcriptional regulator
MMAHGIKKNEDLVRTTITMPVSTDRRLDELMMLMQLTRSEVIAYLVDREAERRQAEIVTMRQKRKVLFHVE